MQSAINQLNLAGRIQAPTPPFFQKLRMAGMVLVAVSTALLAGGTTTVALPVIVTQIAGYLAVAGTVLTAVSQTAVDATEPDSGGTDE